MKEKEFSQWVVWRSVCKEYRAKIQVQIQTTPPGYIKFETIYLNFHFALQEEIHKTHAMGYREE